MKAAFDLNPQQIFLTTDSNSPEIAADEILSQVRQLRAKSPWPIPIHVTALGGGGAEAFLRDLARQSGGDFRIINP